MNAAALGATAAAIPIAALRRDGGTQPRDHVSVEVARDYADAMAGGAILPPVTVFYDGEQYWLADGFHRVLAHELLERVEISADVQQGTRRDAVLWSVGANAVHGYRRSNADKRRAVLVLINDPEWAIWSDREIAKKCSVGRDLVGALRPKPVTVGSDSVPVRVYQDRHGNTSTMKVAAIGKRSRPLPLVAGRVPDHRPDPGASVPDEVYTGSASIVTGFKPERLVKMARAGEIPGAFKESGAWAFDTDQLRRWAFAETAAPSELPHNPSSDGRNRSAVIPATSADQDRLVRDLFDMVGLFDRLGPPGEALAAWSLSRGQDIPAQVFARAAAWLVEFSAEFPSVDAARQIAISNILEKVEADVAA